MEAIVVEVTRGDVVEARHRVHAVAVADGRVVASRGDAGLVTLFRSSAKPIQALPLARLRPDLDDAELAIACASHVGSPDQIEAVKSLLAKASATEADLECGAQTTALAHTCSGKHAAMLVLCRERGWPLEGYRIAGHPCQRELLSAVAAAADVDPDSVPTAVDGCGVVTYGLALERMAHAFARLDALDGGPRVAAAVRARPDIIGDEASPDVELIRLGEGWAAKYGAEGLLCAARHDLGVALKVEDGAQRPLGVALSAFLTQLGLGAGHLGGTAVTNSRDEVVGALRVH
jgi:L-asparaginase II